MGGSFGSFGTLDPRVIDLKHEIVRRVIDLKHEIVWRVIMFVLKREKVRRVIMLTLNIFVDPRSAT